MPVDLKVRLYVVFAAFTLVSAGTVICWQLGLEFGAAFFGGQSSTLFLVLLDQVGAHVKGSGSP